MDASVRRAERNNPERVLVERYRAGKRPMLNLMDFMPEKPTCAADCEGCKTGQSWKCKRDFYGHIGSLLHFVGNKLELLYECGDDDYQGSEYALLKLDGERPVYIIWRDDFGSCSGCDGLEDASPAEAYDYIKATLAEGNTHQFWSLEEACKFFHETEDWLWDPKKYSWNDGIRRFCDEIHKRANLEPPEYRQDYD